MRRFAIVTVLTAVAACSALATRTRRMVYALAGTAAVTLALLVYAVARVRRGRRLS